jgi:hypothetical protein
MIEQEPIFEEILKSEVIATKCNNCGEECIMNIAYAKYVTNGLDKCGKCRRQSK